LKSFLGVDEVTKNNACGNKKELTAAIITGSGYGLTPFLESGINY
jgi:hypothetical protein